MPRLSILLPDGSEKPLFSRKTANISLASVGMNIVKLPFPLLPYQENMRCSSTRTAVYVIEDLGSTNGVKINGLTPMGPAACMKGTILFWERCI